MTGWNRRQWFGACSAATLAASPFWAQHNQTSAHFDWSGLAYTLRKFVTAQGTVNYSGLKQDLQRLRKTADSLATFNPSALPSREAKLAHWINVYNTFILVSFAEDYPKEKHRLRNPIKRANYFYRRKFAVAGEERSLADIEDNSIRSFGDPRIHFAIVCASKSCPWLSREVYTAANLERKLEEEANRFVSQSHNVTLDKVRRVATVSEIFKWFQKDFGGSPESVLRFLAARLPGQNIDAANWKLKYFPYDWSLNEQTG